MKRKHTLRNLLSMVCVIAMIISMVPVLPAAAANETVGSAKAGGVIDFVDANEIENTEAVAITAGMGLFAGTTEGKFDPKGTVTRAQMATIIVKMLRGSDFNADNFKGINKFSDTASFEGGWAEGYINACVQLGVVAGYGDGTFKPGQAVTTAEALTMIINALKVDAGQGEWPNTIMAKAQEMKLYGDLAVKPGTYDALTRDQLAVLAYEGLCYSPSNVSGYKVPTSDIVFADVADALKVCGDPSLITEVVGEDALANKIYELKVFEGFVTANQATGDNAFTTVTAYNADGTTDPVSVDFNMETGLAEIGHYVTVYYRDEYKNDTEPGVVYNYVDETQVVVVTEDITSSKDYKAASGKTTKEAALLNGSDAVLLIAGNYITSVTDNTTRGSIAGYTEGTAAKEGTYLIDDGVVKAYMAPIPVYAAKVRAVNTYEGNESIELSGVSVPVANSEGNDFVREYEGVAKGDYVTYTVVGTGVNAIYVLTKADSVTGVVNKTSVNKDGENVLTINGVDYVQFGGTNNINNISEFQGQAAVNYVDEYTVFITADGKYLGWEQTSGGLNLDDTVFILGELTVVVDDGYGGKVRKTTARGVDMNGNEVNLLMKIEKNGTVETVEGNKVFFPSTNAKDNISDPKSDPVAANTFYTIKLSNDKDAQKESIYTLKEYPTAYDEKTAPIYAGSRTIAVNQAYLNYNFSYGGKVTSQYAKTVYMLLEGTVDQPTPLTPLVQTTDWGTGVNQTGAPIQSYYLFARDSQDKQVAEVMMMIAAQNSDAAKVSEPVYVAEGSRKPVGVDATGYVYEVYDYLTGAKMQITLKTNDALLVDADGDGVKSEIPSVGYWHTIPDAGSTCNVLTAQVTDTVSGTSTISGTGSNSTSNDGLYNENILHNQQFDQIALGGELYTTNLVRGKNPGGALVVDTRDDDVINSFGIGKIDSVDRIRDLLEDNKGLVITFDLCHSTSEGKLKTIFIREVYYASLESGAEIKNVGGVYYLDGKAIDTNNVTITDGTGSLTGTTTDKLDMLVAKSATGSLVGLTYLTNNGKVSSINVDSILKPGVLFEENFDFYAANSTYDLTAPNSTLVKYYGDTYTKGNYSLDIVELEAGNNALKVSATGGTGTTRTWLKTRQKFDGNYTIEARLKTNDVGTLTHIRLQRVTMNKHNATSTEQYQMQLRVDGDDSGIFINTLREEHLLPGAGEVVGTTKTAKLYNNGTPVVYDPGDWYVVKTHISADDMTVITELYDGTGTTLLGSRALPIGTIEAGEVGFESQGADGKTHEAYWDYIMVKEYEYTAAKYDVTVEEINPNGLLSADVTSATEGDTVTFTATAKPGYKLNKLLVNGNDILVSNDNLNQVITTQYTMPAEAIEVKAEFVKIAAYAVSIPANDKGVITVTANGQPVADGAEIMEGTELTISVTNNDPVNWMLKSIDIDGVLYAEKTNTTTYMMVDKAVEITATFDEIIYCNVSVDPGLIDGTIALSQSGDSIPYGTEITVAATPKDGFELKALYVNGVEAADKTKFTLVEDSVVTALFWPVGAVIYDNFEGYANDEFTYGTDDIWGYRSRYNAQSGSATATIVSEEGRGKVLALNTQQGTGTSQIAFATADAYSGNFTVRVDVKAEQEADGDYYATYIALKTTTNNAAAAANLIMRPNTSNFSFTNGNNAEAVKVTGSNEVLKPEMDTWYTVELVVTPSSVTANVYNESGTLLGSYTKTVSITAPLYVHLDHYGYGNAAKTRNSTTYFDNFSVVVND